MRFTRYQMYKRVFGALNLPLRGEILGISGLKFWIGSPNYKPPFEIISKEANVTRAEYPDVNICSLPYKDNTFDYVICDQVMEHVEGNLEVAFEEMRRVLKPGGRAIIATVFMHPVHWGPKDLWRFSPDALRYLCKNFSKIEMCEGWGNRIIHILFMVWDKSRDWQIPEHKFSIRNWLASHNNPNYPSSTWIIAKK